MFDMTTMFKGLSKPDDIFKFLAMALNNMSDNQYLEIEEHVKRAEEMVSYMKQRIEKAKYGRDKAANGAVDLRTDSSYDFARCL